MSLAGLREMTYGAVMPDFGEKMLKRKIEKDLVNWITSGEKALLIYGVLGMLE